MLDRTDALGKCLLSHSGMLARPKVAFTACQSSHPADNRLTRRTGLTDSTLQGGRARLS